MLGLGRHPSSAAWATYLAGEASPADARELRAHADGCARCTAQLERMSALLGLAVRPASEPDELSWRRMESRLEARLQASLPPPATLDEVGHFSMDVPAGFEPLVGAQPPRPHSGRLRWVAATLAAAAMVAIGVAVAPRTVSEPGPRPPPGPLVKAAVVRSGAAPLSVELTTGQALELAAETQLAVPNPLADPPELSLRVGQVRILSPEPASPVLVETPELAMTGRSRDFTVGYRAGRHRIDVEDGYVDVGSPSVRVGAGQVLELPSVPRPAEPKLRIFERLAESTGEDEAEVSPGSAESVDSSGPRAARPSPEAKPVRPGSVPSRTDVAAPAPAPARRSVTEGDTRVEVLSVEVDPGLRALSQARSAWYFDRDAEMASRAASEALESPLSASARLEALELRCDAQVHLRSGQPAVAACRELLRFENDGQRKRRIHFMLGGIFRDHLKDCRSARRHYDQAIVFGGGSPLDQAARLRRAECALELNDLETARSDLDAIQPVGEDAQRAAKARERLAKRERGARSDTNGSE